MPSSKKGRLSGAMRKEINARTVDSAIKSEDVIFGRMNKHFGNGRVEVLIEDERGGKKPVQAHIRRVLTKRGSTPITTNDIVGITSRDYESRLGTDKMTYDLICVLDRKSAATLEKEGKIPKWMLVITDAKSGDAKDGGELFEFDYGDDTKTHDKKKAVGGAGISEESDESDSDDELDIDKI